jgi:4-carboxymuconolactone decarboxylase
MTMKLSEDGLAVRKAVLGAAYVDKQIAAADDFNAEFQELLTNYCWGGVWTRPGLPRKSRSLLNLGMLIALNRPNELRLHLRGAVNNGVTVDEIREVLLQAAIYCGMPAAVDAFKHAREILTEMGKLPAKS